MQVYKTACPICENRVQIIGVCKEKRDTICSPSNIKIYEEKDFLKCAYQRSNRKIYNKKILPTDSKSKYLYRQMKEHFDLIIEILEESLHLHINYHFAETLLRNWKNNEGWNYRDSNFQNLPYMLLYAERSYPLYGKLIRKNSDLETAIMEYGRNFAIQDTNMKHYDKITQKNRFLDAVYYLTNHQFIRKEEHTEESYDLVIVENEKEIYKETIIVKHGQLREMIKKQENRSPREKRLLKIANEILN